MPQKTSKLSMNEMDAGWGRWVLRVRGVQPLLILCFLSVSGTLVYLLTKSIETPISAIHDQTQLQTVEHQHMQQAIETDIALENNNRMKEHQAIEKAQVRIADSLEEQTFLLSLKDAERQKYRLQMPDSMRRKLSNP